MLSLPETIPQKGRYQGSRKSHYLNAWVSFTGVITVEFAIFISELPQPVFPGRAAMAPSSLPCAQSGEMAQGISPSIPRGINGPRFQQAPSAHESALVCAGWGSGAVLSRSGKGKELEFAQIWGRR